MTSTREKKIDRRQRSWKSFSGKPLNLADILEAGADTDGQGPDMGSFEEALPKFDSSGVGHLGILPERMDSDTSSSEVTGPPVFNGLTIPNINVDHCDGHGNSQENLDELLGRGKSKRRSLDVGVIPSYHPSSLIAGLGNKKLIRRKISLNQTVDGVDCSNNEIIALTGPAPGTILSTDDSLTRFGIGSLHDSGLPVPSKPRRKTSSGRSPPNLSPKAAIKRVPSSLFYLDYDDEAEESEDEEYEDEEYEGIDISKARARMPRDTSRKLSAMQYIRDWGRDEAEEEDEAVKEVEKDLINEKEVFEPELKPPDAVPESPAAIDVKSLALCYEDSLKEIDRLMSSFRLGDQFYEEVMALLNIELDRGLVRATSNEATVKMYPTYVRALPDGTEFGRFVALDLGGTNFRVLLVDLKGRETPEVKSKVYLIPMSIMLGPGVMLFDHIVTCISEFLTDHEVKGEQLTLGFTFSFPCCQKGLASAKLVRWTKGFKCSDVESRDVVQLLQEAIDRRGDLMLECVAVINDNVGVLMTGARSDPNCNIGLILGTGTNCCYMEDLKNVELWDGDLETSNQVIINTEWGAFGDNGCLDFIRNRFDHQLDVLSLNAGRQLFEKMISGMYMGEIVRLVLCELTEKNLLFQGVVSDELNEPNRFYTKYISEIESDGLSGEFVNTKQILEEMSLSNYTLDDCRYVQHVCWQVSQRAANLAAAAVATIIKRLELNDVTVAVDGSLYRFHPHFKDIMSKKIGRLIRPWQQFKLTLAHDGSGQGAALVAAVAKRCIEAKNLPTA